MGATGGRIRWLAGAALVAPLLAAAANAQAQDRAAPVAPSTATQVEEVVVTANKREERVQDVALSVTAIPGADLQRLRVQDIQDLAGQTPGLSFQRSGSLGGAGNQIILRGLNTGGDGATVATVVDDAPLSFSSSISGGARFATDFEPFDLQRIEVLRGPQGSLYGATAEGGLIKYVTAPPRLDGYHAGINASVFDLDRGGAGGDVDGYVNAPIGDNAALRIGGYYHDSPGWIGDNLAGIKDANGYRRYGGRASLLIKGGDKLTIRLTAIYQKLEQDGFDAVEVKGYADPNDRFGLLHGYNLDTFLPQPTGTEAQLYSANISYDLGPATVQSISSYGRLDNLITNDVPIYGQAFGGLLFGRPNTTLFYGVNTALKKVNQEVRLLSNGAAAEKGHGLQWQVGFFYTDEHVQIGNDYYTRDITTGQRVDTPSFGSAQALQSDETQKYREIAGYADFTYFFNRHFDIEAGGRVFNNEQSRRGVQGGAFVGVPLGTVIPQIDSGETSGTFAVSPRYHINKDLMVYGRVASGYRPGGPETYIANAPASLPREYGSDSTVNYEVGLKGLLLDRKLTVDVAAFYIDWSDVQINVTVPVNQGQANAVAYTLVQNAGTAVSQGVEWSLTYTPVRGLTLGALGAYTDAHLTEDAPGIGGLKDDRLPYVPKISYTFSANYEWPLFGDVRASLGGNYSHTGDRYSTYTLTPSLSHQQFPGYDTLFLQAGLRRGNLGLQLYAKNVNNERGITYYYAGQTVPSLGGASPGQIGLIRPREVGLRLSADF